MSDETAPKNLDLGQPSHKSRICRIAEALGMDLLPGAWVERHRGRWWLVGAVGGDQPLPFTSACTTLPEVLDAIEAWLAPEIDV